MSLWDDLTKGFGDAVADIREKVVEEPFFGRVVTERDGPLTQWPETKEPDPGSSFGSLTREWETIEDKGIDR